MPSSSWRFRKSQRRIAGAKQAQASRSGAKVDDGQSGDAVEDTSTRESCDSSVRLSDRRKAGSPPSTLPTNGPQWLLQAAETVFTPSTISPDVFTEELAGRRRPLILAALAWAVETEERLLQGSSVGDSGSPHSSGEKTRLDKQQWTAAFDLVRFLLARGASLRMPSETGVLPLEYAIKSQSLWATALLLSAAQCLSEEGENLFPLHHGLSPLHLAAAEDNLPLAALLLGEHSDVHMRKGTRCRECGNNGLHFKYGEENPSFPSSSSVLVQLPLCRRCLVNSRDSRGCTAAFYSCSRAMLRLLLDSGVSFDSVSSAGDTLLHALVYNARRPSRQTKNWTAPLTPCTTVCDCKCSECSGKNHTGAYAVCRITVLLQRVPLASATSQRGVEESDEEGLPRTSPTPFIDRRNNVGWTALHVAAARGYTDVCKVLLGFGADPALATTKLNLLPADLALRRQHWSTAKTLRNAERGSRPLPSANFLRNVLEKFNHSRKEHPLLFLLSTSLLGLLCLNWEGAVAALKIYFPTNFGPLRLTI
ncbi:hypothetical protein Efla_002831 [Eimeria flavescens]